MSETITIERPNTDGNFVASTPAQDLQNAADQQSATLGDNPYLSDVVDAEYSQALAKVDGELYNLAGTIINILTRFDWSLNYKNRNNKLPAIYAVEYRQNLSTLIASLSWALNAGANTFAGVSIGKGLSETINTKTTGTKKSSSVADKIKNITVSQDTAGGNEFNANIGRFGDVMAPYKMMYSYMPTGTKYVFPYFESPSFEFSNAYGDTEQGGQSIITQTLSEWTSNTGWGAGGMKIWEDLKKLTNWIGNGGSKAADFRDRGIFIERPQFFQYDTTKDSVVTNFTLYNTITKDAWKKNYAFIKSLVFKNSPYKLSVFKYKTPVLYEIQIPGVKYYPIAFISSFSATNLGTMRFIDNVLVPEAWNISITFQSLLNRSGNLIQAATINNSTNIVTGVR